MRGITDQDRPLARTVYPRPVLSRKLEECPEARPSSQAKKFQKQRVPAAEVALQLLQGRVSGTVLDPVLDRVGTCNGNVEDAAKRDLVHDDVGPRSDPAGNA